MKIFVRQFVALLMFQKWKQRAVPVEHNPQYSLRNSQEFTEDTNTIFLETGTFFNKAQSAGVRFPESRSTLGSNQPALQCLPETPPPEVKRQDCEADHSPPANAEVKKDGAVTPLPHTSS
jgi:hypothetical protein